jgi:hypothetical protein
LISIVDWEFSLLKNYFLFSGESGEIKITGFTVLLFSGIIILELLCIKNLPNSILTWKRPSFVALVKKFIREFRIIFTARSITVDSAIKLFVVTVCMT